MNQGPSSIINDKGILQINIPFRTTAKNINQHKEIVGLQMLNRNTTEKK